MVIKSKSKSTRKPKVNNLRHAEYYDMQDTFDALFAKSVQGETFEGLMDLILSRENILLAYRNIKRNDGSVTPGTDGLTMRDIEKHTPDGLVQKVRSITRNYSPRAVRRKEIPKLSDPSKTRPLGIPCIWDRIIQQCILQVLEPICEAKFSDNSYGFRPNRSCENAVAAAYLMINRSHLQYVVEVDIKGFFDNVDHSKLIRQIWALGIHDKHLIYVIKRILKAPIQLENGTTVIPEKGTPQGGIISPLLANIVLNEMDRWVESQWQDHPAIANYVPFYNSNGSVNKGNAYAAMKKTQLKEIRIVRYADDFRIFCRKKEDAHNALSAVTQWLEQRLRLEVSPEKTRVVNLKKRYSEFLGIKMRMKSKRGKQVVQSHVCDSAINRIKTVAKGKMKDIAHPKKGKTVANAMLNYNTFVMGVHNYYQMATDVSLDFDKIAFEVKKTAKRLRGLKKNPATKVNAQNAIVDRYGSSAQLRWLRDRPIAPIGFVQTVPPMSKKRSVQKYTPEGRKEIHADLGIPTGMLQALLRQQLHGRSAEFADNRLSLYCAQYGKCAITGQIFEMLEDIHCHHMAPKNKGGKDNYQNLMLILEDVHRLIHATAQPTIDKYLAGLNLDKGQIRKINKLRKEAGHTPIIA